MEALLARDLFTIRPYKKEDEAFLYSSWLKGLYYGNSFFRKISDKDEFFDNYRKVITSLLLSPKTTVLCAVLKEDEDTILGFSVFSHEALHWVFVKDRWRGIGVARSLIPPEVKIVTHMSDMAEPIARRRNLKFNPFKL